MTGDHLRQRSDNIGLVAVLVGAMELSLPWWAWRRRRALRSEAEKMIRVAQDIKSQLREVSHG